MNKKQRSHPSSRVRVFNVGTQNIWIGNSIVCFTTQNWISNAKNYNHRIFFPIICKQAFAVGLTGRLNINARKGKISSLKRCVYWETPFPIFTFPWKIWLCCERCLISESIFSPDWNGGKEDWIIACFWRSYKNSDISYLISRKNQAKQSNCRLLCNLFYVTLVIQTFLTLKLPLTIFHFYLYLSFANSFVS